LGYKANMTNIDASILINQLKRIESLRKVREKIANYYDSEFSKNPKIRIIQPLANSKHGRFIYTIQVNPKKRDQYIEQFEKKGIPIAVHFKPVHEMSFYKKALPYKRGSFPVAEKMGSSTITLPFYPKLTTVEQKYITKTINNIV